MAHLARLGSRVRQALRRWLPVDDRWSGQRPDHAFHWVLRGPGPACPEPCCEYHAQHLFDVPMPRPLAYHRDPIAWLRRR